MLAGKLKIKFDGDRFVARLSKNMKDTVIRAGFLWDEFTGEWYAPNPPRSAYRLADHVESLNDLAVLYDLLKLRFRPETDFTIVQPQGRGLTAYGHQVQGAQWVLSRRSSYLAMEAGTGKTAIAPLCINTVGGKTIVVCPPFLKLNWEYELERWLCDFHFIQVFNKGSDIPNPHADIYVVPDSLIVDHDFRERLVRLGVQFKFLFIDEAHRFKTPTARRSLSLLGSRQVKLGKGRTKRLVTWKGFHRIADHVVAMSGTPMPNRPLELYPLISRHAPHALNYLDPHRYGVRYCNGFEAEYGWDYQGASNLDELNRVLCRNYMLVKKLRDCVDLPEKLPPSYIYLTDQRGELKKDEMRLLKTMRLSEIIDLVSLHNEDFRQRVQDKLEDNPDMGAFGFISELRKMLGLAKVKESVQVIKQLLEDNHKIIVFCWHKEVVQEVHAALENFGASMITGQTPNKQRQKIVQDFQTKKDVRLLVANIQAAGVGYTMTASSTVVFVEPSWVPADNDQAISRADRITQTESVRSYFLVVKDSLDHLILNAHINKNETINAAIKPI